MVFNTVPWLRATFSWLFGMFWTPAAWWRTILWSTLLPRMFAAFVMSPRRLASWPRSAHFTAPSYLHTELSIRMQIQNSIDRSMWQLRRRHNFSFAFGYAYIVVNLGHLYASTYTRIPLDHYQTATYVYDIFMPMTFGWLVW